MGQTCHIDPAGSHIGGDQNLEDAVFELPDHFGALRLGNIAVECLHAVFAFGKLFAEFIHIQTGAAEHKTVHFRIHIHNTDQCFHFFLPSQFIAETIDLIQTCHFRIHADHFTIRHEFFCNCKDLLRHGGGKHEHPPVFGNTAEKGIDIIHKTHIQHFVGFIKDGEHDIFQIQCTTVDHILHASGRADHNIDTLFQCAQLQFNGGSAIDRCHKQMFRTAKTFDLRGNLHTQFAGRRENNGAGLTRSVAIFQTFNNGNPECCCFSRSGAGLTQYIAFSGKQQGNRRSLNGSGCGNAFFRQRIQRCPGKSEISKSCRICVVEVVKIHDVFLCPFSYVPEERK